MADEQQPRTDKSRLILEMATEASTCPACDLSQTRTKVVFGDGNAESPLMLIGEGPGANEDATGLPFVGRAGKLLDECLREAGMLRKHIYLTNVVKCRATLEEMGKIKNRPPRADEAGTCVSLWLDKQIAVVQPLVILCLGAPSANAIIHKNFKMTQERGQWFESRYVRYAMAALHPAYILRQEGEAYDQARQFLIDDLIAARDKAKTAKVEPKTTLFLINTYRLAAIDLDGTLLHSGTHAVTDGNAAAVREAVKNGAQIVLASGRQWMTINKVAELLDLPSDAPIIAYNGAMIRTHGGELWYHQPLPADAAAKIVAYCAANGCHLNYYLDDELYVRDHTKWVDVYRQRTGTIAHITGDLGKFDGRQPTKLILVDTLETTNRLLTYFQAEFGNSLYITKTEDEYLEFMDPSVNKGHALAEVAKHLGLTSDQCVAFGDSFNDTPMLEWVGLGVAMENARTELKAIAKKIAPPADADGVGTVLAELFPAHA